MIPGLDVLLTGGAGGFSGSSSASSATGPINFGGGFTFQPKGGSFPPLAWAALAAVGIAALVIYSRRK